MRIFCHLVLAIVCFPSYWVESRTKSMHHLPVNISGLNRRLSDSISIYLVWACPFPADWWDLSWLLVIDWETTVLRKWIREHRLNSQQMAILRAISSFAPILVERERKVIFDWVLLTHKPFRSCQLHQVLKEAMRTHQPFAISDSKYLLSYTLPRHLQPTKRKETPSRAEDFCMKH